MTGDTNTIEAEAIDWVIRRDSGKLSAEELRTLEDWLAADPRHRGAYVRADANWVNLDQWAAHRRTQSSAALTWNETLSRWRWAFAAGIAAMMITGATAWYLQRDATEVYASVIGEVRNIELSDGSHIILNTDSVATVRFEESERGISLEQGEALFQVAHDVNRPFVVRANDVHIKAIGTAFTVRLDNGRTDVLVTEGVVEVSRDSASGREIRRVSAAQRVTLATRESRADIEPVPPETMQRKLAWRQGKAIFVGEPLSAAVVEMNRHSRRQLHVDDVSLAGRRVIGVFNANDVTAFAKAVAATFGAEVVEEQDGIHLRPAAPTTVWPYQEPAH